MYNFVVIDLQVCFFFTLFRLEVEIQGQPEPSVTWYKNQVELSPTPHMEMTQDKQTYVLVIVDTKVEDTGEYTFKGENTLGQITCTTTLTVTRE